MLTPAALLADARAAAERSYSPYSGFAVGAAVLTDAGEVILGCNVENAAYGESICAERNAVTTMVARGGRHVEAVAVVGLRAAPCWPCGACRQVLREFGCREVIVEDAEGQPVTLDFSRLLPNSFGPDTLDP